MLDLLKNSFKFVSLNFFIQSCLSESKLKLKVRVCSLLDLFLTRSKLSFERNSLPSCWLRASKPSVFFFPLSRF